MRNNNNNNNNNKKKFVKPSKSYKPLVGYYLLICVICSCAFSLYSFIMMLFDPIINETTIEKNIKYYNMIFIVNTLAIIATCQYILMICVSLCNVLSYNSSKVLYVVFYYNYVILNIVSFIILVSHINSFNFFKTNYNYYYISLIIQFSICALSMFLQIFVCFCQPKKIQYIQIQNNFNDDEN